MRRYSLTQEPVYCLHIRKYRETSAVLSCFSETYGRLDVLAKGLYRKKSKNDLPAYFQEYKLSAHIKTELGILTELELITAGEKLLGQEWLTACYCNELLLKFIPKDEPVGALYLAYQDVLIALQQKKNYPVYLLWFEKRLLEILGYGINFNYAAHSEHQIEAHNWYQFEVGSGFQQVAERNAKSLPGFVIQAMADEQWGERENEFFTLAKRVVRSSLKYQLGEQALKTVTVSKELQDFVPA